MKESSHMVLVKYRDKEVILILAVEPTKMRDPKDLLQEKFLLQMTQFTYICIQS